MQEQADEYSVAGEHVEAYDGTEGLTALTNRSLLFVALSVPSALGAAAEELWLVEVVGCQIEYETDGTQMVSTPVTVVVTMKTVDL